MEEIGLPCSVITSHSECSAGSNDILQPTTATTATNTVVPYVELSHVTHQDLKPGSEECSSLGSVTVYEIVSVWPQPNSTTAILQESLPVVNDNIVRNEDSLIGPRTRKVKRPYSPEGHIANKKVVDKRKGVRKQKRFLNFPEVLTDIPEASDNGKPFRCDKCQSPFIVNPARSHRLNSKRKYRPRKVIDPSTKNVLVLCNACGLSMTRKGKTKKEKHKKILPSVEEKEAYLKKATEFAESLVATLQNPDAVRLFCPAFKTSPCQCLQKYITGDGKCKDEEGIEERAMHLLTLLKDAKQLTRHKTIMNASENCEESADKDVTEKQKNQKAQFPRGLQKRKCKEFEDFVLENRKYLREELHLCERGVQKVLMYSNNFLHKKLKTSPNRSCRLERSIGKNARGVLKPISELINEPCCSDKCVAMAQTHSKLLEDWRNIAKKGQREARRVLAEMLTPSGGTKANCYKFISMVTGCSYATICLVNDQMRRTQGEREPPEHGLKKWWREHPRDKEKQMSSGDHTARAGNSDEDDPDVVMDVASIHIPTREELETLCPQEATTQLQLQREKLLEAQKQLLEQQAQLQQQLKQTKSKSNGNKHFTTNTEKTIPIPVLTTHSPFENRNIETMTVLTPAETNETSAEILARSTTQRVLHILELPTSSPSVITSLSESVETQPTISVMASTGEFEPLTDLSVNLEGRGPTTFSNVVILPEATIETSTISASTAAQGTSVISYSPPVDNVGAVISSQEQQTNTVVDTSLETGPDVTKPTSEVGTFQFYGVMDAAASNLLHFNY